jgi:hypothetical protein
MSKMSRCDENRRRHHRPWGRFIEEAGQWKVGEFDVEFDRGGQGGAASPQTGAPSDDNAGASPAADGSGQPAKPTPGVAADAAITGP